MAKKNTPQTPLTPAVLHILLALSTGERHGYGIMKQVEADSQGTVKMGPGTLYGSIGRMTEAGLVKESGKRVDPEMDDEGRTLGCLIALLFFTGECFSTQTIYLNHSSSLCTETGGVKLKGTWNNAADCTQTTTYSVGSLATCNDNESASGPLQCHFFCCCHQEYTDKDSRTIDDNCDLSTISAQVTIRNVCD